MLTSKHFASLKKSGVSADDVKSYERISEAYKDATTEQKEEISKLSGLSKYSFYKGSASPKSVLSLAQTLSISPYYLTGESDDKNFTEDMLMQFYNRCIRDIGAKTESKASSEKKKVVKAAESKSGKSKKTAAKKAGTKTTVKEKAKKTAAVKVEKTADVTTPAPVKVAAAKKEAKVNTPVAKAPKIDDESLVSLLRALAIRAKFGGDAKETYDAVVDLLLS